MPSYGKEMMDMYQGFYNLTSGMLTQSRNLNVISNNMANVSTPGYISGIRW